VLETRRREYYSPRTGKGSIIYKRLARLGLAATTLFAASSASNEYCKTEVCRLNLVETCGNSVIFHSLLGNVGLKLGFLQLKDGNSSISFLERFHLFHYGKKTAPQYPSPGLSLYSHCITALINPPPQRKSISAYESRSFVFPSSPQQ
jgi:hypothetical protein